MLGHFLGPSTTDRHMHLRVEDVRTTRTFATRRVVVSQVQDDGSSRDTLAVTLDFMSTSPVSVLSYSTPPPQITHHSQLPPYLDALDARVAAGTLPEQVSQVYSILFGLMFKMMDVKIPEDAILGNNAWGVNSKAKTAQDHLAVTEKRSSHWMRSKLDFARPDTHSAPPSDALAISPESANASAIAFSLDFALAFIPLSYSNRFLPDVGACSTLDFALRFHSDQVDLRKWHLEEIKTITGDHGRTFTEGVLWGEDGKMVATMSQQSVLWPQSSKKVSSL